VVYGCEFPSFLFFLFNQWEMVVVLFLGVREGVRLWGDNGLNEAKVKIG